MAESIAGFMNRRMIETSRLRLPALQRAKGKRKWDDDEEGVGKNKNHPVFRGKGMSANDSQRLARIDDQRDKYGQKKEEIWSSKSIPARAKGGKVKKGKAYIVGEKGAEKFVPKKDGKIIPHKKLKKKKRGRK
jgi:hypothetical protein